MKISARLGVSAASAAATLALAIASFGFATPAGAEPITAASGSSSATTSPTTTASPTASPSAAPVTIPTPAPTPKPSAPTVKKGKAKISNYKRLTKKAKKVATTVRDRWHRIKKIGGWRAGSRYSGDHPAGRAIDVMIPSWRKNAGLGKSIATFFTKNAKKYKIHYVIYRQKIWTTQNSRWRAMANRGGATANHFDHVHISVKR